MITTKKHCDYNYNIAPGWWLLTEVYFAPFYLQTSGTGEIFNKLLSHTINLNIPLPFNYILPLKMFKQQNGLVDPKEGHFQLAGPR